MGMIEIPIERREPVMRWIPVSERLPEDGRQVLVYAMSVHYALAKYDEMREADGTYKKQWVTFDAWKPFYAIKNVIAWMPLPEPYDMQTAEPERKGEWIDRNGNIVSPFWERYECSECGARSDNTNYCPNCGDRKR